MFRAFAILILIATVVRSSSGEIPHATDAPRPLSPSESAAQVKLPPGFRLELVAAVATRDGNRVIRASAHGFRNKAAALGVRVGRDLIEQGADAILAEVRVS